MTDTLEGVAVFTLGLLLLAGYASHALGARLHVPRVTLLLLLGLACGPSGLDIVPPTVSEWFSFVSHMALAMVGFLLGESFVGKHLKQLGRAVFCVSLGVTLLSALLVFVGALLMGAPLAVALVLAGIAPATAPAATLDIVRESGARGPLTRIVLGVVAIDDAWGVMLFSLLLALAQSTSGIMNIPGGVLRGIWEIAGAGLVGVAVGIPMAWLTGRLKEGEPALLEAAGFVFLCGGLSLMLDVSYLLACMVLGAVVGNRATHYTRPFHAIEGVSDPFLAIFFLLAGFSFEVDALSTLAGIGAAYVLARSAGRILGARLGARLGDLPPAVGAHVGWCLLPQAGLALGFALLVRERLPEVGDVVLPLIIATTVLFEVAGPAFTQAHLRRAGEID